MRLNLSNNTYRWVARLYVLAAVLYVLLGFTLIANAYARGQEVNPMIPVPSEYTDVPTGSDDEAVEAYYDYLNYRHLDELNQTYLFDPLGITTIYGILGGILVISYFFAFAWHARMSRGDLYPVEVFNGYLSERGGPVDPFNWAVYAILIAYMVYYTVVHLIFGQYY